jgi:anti-sigma factor RsiW
MDCAEKRNLIHGYLDGELDLLKSIEMEAHLKECPACSHVLENHRALRAALASGSVAYEAPTALERRIRASLRKERPRAFTLSLLSWRWLSLAASAAAVALLTWNLAPRLARPSAEEQLTREVVSSHVRSLMASHLADVVSTDQHTVKPWFDGKLDFAPPVNDFAVEGFPLAGGRLDYLNDRPVAALVYQRRKHFINLFIWPAREGGESGERTATRQGYNILHWRKGGMNFWAVSDVSATDLEEFVRLERR